ncbi:MAG: cell division protein FtsZ [Candidatus Bathyarchaeia archaeon]
MSAITDAFKPEGIRGETRWRGARVFVTGVGGAGCNTCNRLTRVGVEGARTISINTDAQQLDLVASDLKIQIGPKTTRGLGAGGNPRLGREAIEESMDSVINAMKGVDIAYVITGLGGGTGTGAAPIISKICQDVGALVIGIVTLPFRHEGGVRMSVAAQGLGDMRRYCDTIVVIQNDRLMELVPQLPVDDAFEIADRVMADMIKGVVEAISAPSLINLDFNDFKAVMENGGVAVIGVGESEAPERAEEAVREAMSCPLLSPIDYTGATGALIHVAGDEGMTLQEAVRVPEIIHEYLNEDAKVFWGPRIDPKLNGALKVTLVLTGAKSSNILPGYNRSTIHITELEPYAGPERPLGLDLGLVQLL